MVQINTLNVPAIYNAIEDTKARRHQNQLYQMQTEDIQAKRKSDEETAGFKDMYAAMKWATTEPKWNQAKSGYAEMGVEGLEQYQFQDRDRLMAMVGGKLGIKPPDPYTLSAGAGRYGPNNKLLAEQPFKPSAESATQKKVEDKSSPTGWSWEAPNGTKMKGAPPPGGQEITVDKDGNIRIGPMTGSQAGKRTSEALDAKESATSAISEVEATLGRLKKTPEAVGIWGEVVQGVGGLIEQIPLMGDAAGEWLNTKEIQATRTQLKSLVGKFVKPITGDTSGRYSDRDMQLVSIATRADDPLASVQQVTTALRAIKEITQRDYARANMKLANVPDLTSSVGIEEYAAKLRQEHPDWDDNRIVDFIISERQKYGVPAERSY